MYRMQPNNETQTEVLNLLKKCSWSKSKAAQALSEPFKICTRCKRIVKLGIVQCDQCDMLDLIKAGPCEKHRLHFTLRA